MTVDFGETYRNGFRRVDARVRALSAQGRAPDGIAVPACPGWSVHDVVAHLTGVAVDATDGRLRGIPDDDWTAGQVAERAGRPVEDVLDEWATRVEPFAAVITKHALFPPAADVLTHEGDIAEALGDPAPAEDGWGPFAGVICGEVLRQVTRPGSLTVSTASGAWQAGAGGDGPVARVQVDAWELFRALMSRRSRAQMRAWPWDGDPAPWLDEMTVFGVREDDQPVAG